MTYEILETPAEDGYKLRIFSASELHAEHMIEEAEADGEAEGEGEGEGEAAEDGMPMRTNQGIVDDASTQRLTWQEIEALKESAGSGQEIIAKILESHSALDQKTAFSLAKYTLRKRKKYMKRFTVLPMDVSTLANFMLAEKDASRTMEMRDEHIGLLGCFGNVHHSGGAIDSLPDVKQNGRYLVVDETGGLIVAAMAERMGILYPHDNDDELEDEVPTTEGEANTENQKSGPGRRRHNGPALATNNTLTLLHAQAQPNLSLLKYFGYDMSAPDESHPLHTHLKTLSWIQLVDPARDPIIAQEPAEISAEELAQLKTNKRTTYYFKRNRYQKSKAIADEARAGGFDGLIAGTLFDPASVLKHAVPLLSGSAQVSVYYPYIEPLVNLMDLYSTTRRTTFINKKRELEETQRTADGKVDLSSLHEEFVLDPTLLLPPTLHHTRVRGWQVLPGRTHPLMTSRGGAEGYLFHGMRVIPTEESIQAAGTFRKKRKIETTSTPAGDSDVVML